MSQQLSDVELGFIHPFVSNPVRGDVHNRGTPRAWLSLDAGIKGEFIDGVTGRGPEQKGEDEQGQQDFAAHGCMWVSFY